MVTSTPAEHASIVADDTPYLLTSKEAVMTGLPRLDRLGRLGQRVRPEQRDYVLIAPTWRQHLAARNPTARPGDRLGVRPDFADSGFAKAWLEILTDEDFAKHLRASGKRLAVLPHQNLARAFVDLPIPDDVKIFDFARDDVQRLFAKTAILLTDYSSMQFNAAFLSRPVVYYQFDKQEYYSGPHPSRIGYFDLERDGFGPVVQTAAEAKQAVVSLLENVPQQYLDRMDAAFPVKDGGNCERVVQAISALGTPRRDTDGPLANSLYTVLTEIADSLGPTSRLRRAAIATAATYRQLRHRLKTKRAPR
jgi:hypothetical protein